MRCVGDRAAGSRSDTAARPRTLASSGAHRQHTGASKHRLHEVRPSQPRAHAEVDGSSSVWARFGAAALSAALVLSSTLQPAPAEAVLNSPNAQIARSADAALRRSVPAFNLEVKGIQRSLEDVQYLLRIPQRKPFGSMANSVQGALDKFKNKTQLLEGAPADSVPEAEAALDRLFVSLQKLQTAIASQQSDYIGLRVAEALKATADLELLQAPGLPFALPKEYQQLPRLVGRAVVSLDVERTDGSPPTFVDSKRGGVSNTGQIQITLDGYSAPITAANFLVNVMEGRYNNRVLTANRTAVVAPTVPMQAAPAVLPLEILPLGEFSPVYRSPLDVQGGELPVLPLSIDGAVSMARVPGTDSYLDADAFFIYKFDKQQAGLAGLAFDEGTFAVFGYVTDGLDIVARLAPGDVIKNAKVVSGSDKLVLP